MVEVGDGGEGRTRTHAGGIGWEFARVRKARGGNPHASAFAHRMLAPASESAQVPASLPLGFSLPSTQPGTLDPPTHPAPSSYPQTCPADCIHHCTRSELELLETHRALYMNELLARFSGCSSLTGEQAEGGQGRAQGCVEVSRASPWNTEWRVARRCCRISERWGGWEGRAERCGVRRQARLCERGTEQHGGFLFSEIGRPIGSLAGVWRISQLVGEGFLASHRASTICTSGPPPSPPVSHDAGGFRLPTVPSLAPFPWVQATPGVLSPPPTGATRSFTPDGARATHTSRRRAYARPTPW